MKRLHYLIIIVLCSPTALLFQNCTGVGSPPPPFSAYNLAYNHPDPNTSSSGVLAQGHIVMGDQEYLQSVFVDVFSVPDQDPNVTGYIAAVIQQEFLPEQFMLGRPCDPFETGDLSGCNYLVSNIENVMLASSSAIREAARIQVCRRLLANNYVLANAISKVQGDQDTPNDMSVIAAIRLFYPASDNALAVQSALLSMDETMAAASENVTDRWRLLFLTLCESPSWQIL